MASVQFDGGKCHGAGEAKAMMRHACADERVRHEHSNEDIDISRTGQNSDLHGLTYGQMCDAYDKAIAAYQKAATKALRRDAVTLYDAIITVPQDLPPEKQDAWFRDVERTINAHYKKPVVLDIKIHRDEIHDYTDPATHRKVTSRVHGHAFMFPDVDGRLNAKKFSSRSSMRQLNREIDAMSREKYHCAFLTGEQTKDRGFQTVEQLKQASDNAELQRQARQARQAAEREQARVDELAMERTIYTAAQVADSEKRAKSGVFDRDTVKLPREDYEALLRSARAGEEAIRQARQMAKERKAAEKAAQAKLTAAERKADEMIAGADRQATQILEQAKQEARGARQKAAEWTKQARAVESAHEEYEAVKRDSERFQRAMRQEYTRSIFTPSSKLGWGGLERACDNGRGVVRYEDGRMYRISSWDETANGGRFYDDIQAGRAVAGELKDEPTQEVPDRILREVRQLAKGRQVSRDLRAVLNHAEGLDIAQRHSRGIR